MKQLCSIVATILLLAFVTSNLACSDSGNELVNASEVGDLTKVKALLNAGAPINSVSSIKFGWTPLMAALYGNKTNVVYYLVEAGADVNKPDREETTPLMQAIARGDENLEVVRFLIDHGANANAKDKMGASVLSYASSSPPKPLILETVKNALKK